MAPCWTAARAVCAGADVWLFDCSGQRPLQGTPKTGTISKAADGWYACIAGTAVPVEPLPRTGEAAGSEVGLKVLRITADGEVVENPRSYRTAEKHLAKAQRRVSRRQKGSKRRKKAVALRKRN